MRRMQLLTTVLAMIAIGSAVAQEPVGAEPELTVTLSCSGAFPSGAVSCFVEQRLLTLGPFEFSLGVDAAVFLRDRDADIAAYGTMVLYRENFTAWIELALPEVLDFIGRPDYLRVGFSTRF